MKETDADLEAKLLAILNEPEETTKMVDAITKTVDGEGEALDEDQRATLQSLLEAGMPTPEEIIQSAKCAEHNAKIQAKRQAELAERRERRAKGIKPKKRRRK